MKATRPQTGTPTEVSSHQSSVTPRDANGVAQDRAKWRRWCQTIVTANTNRESQQQEEKRQRKRQHWQSIAENESTGANPQENVEAIFYAALGDGDTFSELDGNSFSSMTFVLDNGAPKHLYLGSHAMSLFESHGLIHEDADSGIDFVVLFGSKCPVVETPPGHAPANVIGLPLLMRWSLHLDQDSFSFSLNFSCLCK
eukprot:gene28011-33825_t